MVLQSKLHFYTHFYKMLCLWQTNFAKYVNKNETLKIRFRYFRFRGSKIETVFFSTENQTDLFTKHVFQTDPFVKS